MAEGEGGEVGFFLEFSEGGLGGGLAGFDVAPGEEPVVAAFVFAEEDPAAFGPEDAGEEFDCCGGSDGVFSVGGGGCVVERGRLLVFGAVWCGGVDLRGKRFVIGGV